MNGWRRAVLWLSLPAAALVIVLVFAFDPQRYSFFPPCAFHKLTGWNCPGCGSTRAIHALLHGHFLEAMGKNPLMVLSLPILVAMLVFPRLRMRPSMAWGALIVLIAYTIVRNIPVYPFNLLAP